MKFRLKKREYLFQTRRKKNTLKRKYLFKHSYTFDGMIFTISKIYGILSD